MTRAERVKQVYALRDKGYLIREIAEELDLSRSYVSCLLTDPSGEGEQKRRERYQGKCEICGGPTSGSDGRPNAPKRCIKCAMIGKRFWTQERIISSIKKWNEIYGEPPKSSEWLTGEIAKGNGTIGSRKWPACATVLLRFGSWSNAIEAAGFERREIGQYERTPEVRAKLSASLRALHSKKQQKGEISHESLLDDLWKILNAAQPGAKPEKHGRATCSSS